MFGKDRLAMTSLGLSEDLKYENSQYLKAYDANVESLSLVKQGHLRLLQMPLVWNYSEGKDITVAVIDSGVNADSESLAGAVLPGYDFIHDHAEQQDQSGHGTAIATLIAGRGPFLGMAPQAKILPLRVLDAHNQGEVSELIRAILFAANLLEGVSNPYKADIINLSLGISAYSEALHDAIKRASQAGVLIIAAVGNETASVNFPARFPEVVAVGAAEVLQGHWRLTPYSNFGQGLDLLAPAGGWTMTNSGSYYETGLLSYGLKAEWYHGTSFAGALVAGFAALLVERLSDKELAKTYLLGSASDLNNSGWDNLSGFGLINPLAALAATQVLPANREAAIVVQVLDAGSHQELGRFYGGWEQALSIPEGSYKLRIWQDFDRNGLWSADEPYVDTKESLVLSPYKQERLELRLGYLRDDY